MWYVSQEENGALAGRNCSGVANMTQKRIEERKGKLLAELSKLKDKKAEAIAKASIHSKMSRTITCAICDHKFIRAEVEGEQCPSCGAELRSFPALQKIAKLDERITDIKRILAELEKNS
jgi:rubrerythrin